MKFSLNMGLNSLNKYTERVFKMAATIASIGKTVGTVAKATKAVKSVVDVFKGGGGKKSSGSQGLIGGGVGGDGSSSSTMSSQQSSPGSVEVAKSYQVKPPQGRDLVAKLMKDANDSFDVQELTLEDMQNILKGGYR
jgi:hypothetical protein